MRDLLRTAALVAVMVFALAGCQPKTPPPAASAPPLTPAERLDAAKAALTAGDAAKALPELTDLARHDPKSAEIQLLLGVCAYKLGDADRGEAALRRVMALTPDSPRPYEALGIAEYLRKRPAEARSALETAVAKGSTNPRTYYYLGNLALATGDCHNGIESYRQALALDATFTPARTEYESAWHYCAGPGGARQEPPAP